MPAWLKCPPWIMSPCVLFQQEIFYLTFQSSKKSKHTEIALKSYLGGNKNISPENFINLIIGKIKKPLLGRNPSSTPIPCLLEAQNQHMHLSRIISSVMSESKYPAYVPLMFNHFYSLLRSGLYHQRVYKVFHYGICVWTIISKVYGCTGCCLG